MMDIKAWHRVHRNATDFITACFSPKSMDI